MILEKNIIKFKKSENSLLINEINLASGVYLVQGQNGAGKSTFLKMLASSKKYYYAPEINKVTYIGQEIDLFLLLTVKANVEILLPTNLVEEVLEELKEMSINLKTKVSKLSGGEQKLVFLLINLARDSELLIIDEFENDLDNNKINYISNKIAIKQANYIFIASHKQLNIRVTGKLRIVGNQMNLVEYNKELTNYVVSNKKVTNHLSEDSLSKISKYYNMHYSLVAVLSMILGLVIILLISKVFVNLSMIERVVTTPFADNVSVVIAPRYTEDYAQIGTEDYLKEIEYGFDTNFIDNLTRQQFVDNVEVTGIPNQIMSYFALEDEGDLVGLDLDQTIDYSKIDYSKFDDEYENVFQMELIPKSYTNLMFEQIVYPNKLVMTTPYYSQGQTDFWYGEIPKEETNEVAIDPYLAMYLATIQGVTLGDLIGSEQTVKLNIYDSNLEVIGQRDKVFIIRGIYKSGTGDILYSYHKDAEIVQGNICVNPTQIQTITNCKNTFGVDYANADKQTQLDSVQIQNKDLREYGQATSLYVETTSENGEQQLVDYLKSVSKYISVDNNYTRAMSTTNKKYEMFILKNSLMLALVAGIYLTLLLIVYKFLVLPKVDDNNSLLTRYAINERGTLIKHSRTKYNIINLSIIVTLGLLTVIVRGINIFSIFVILFLLLIQLLINLGLKRIQ